MPNMRAFELSTSNGISMNAWSGSTQTRLSQSTVLLIGPDSRIQRSLVRELQALSAEAITANDLDDASHAKWNSRQKASVMLIPESTLDPTEFEEQLGELRIRTGSPTLVPIAFGQTPFVERRRALRNAGIELALFGRFGRHALRFQINRALSPWRPVNLAANFARPRNGEHEPSPPQRRRPFAATAFPRAAAIS
jgi:hypothetical protein